jgi:hypothetical protein
MQIHADIRSAENASSHGDKGSLDLNIEPVNNHVTKQHALPLVTYVELQYACREILAILVLTDSRADRSIEYVMM